MKRSRGLFLIIAFLGAGLGAVALGSMRTDAAPPEETGSARRSTGAAPTAGVAELAELRREVAQLRRQVLTQDEHLSIAEGAWRDRKTPADSADPRSALDQPAEDERRHRELMAGVDAAFRGEEADPQWAAAASLSIDSVLHADSDLRQLARRIECRSRTCRVEITDDGSEKFRNLLPTFLLQVGQELGRVTANRIEDASGVATMVLYMSRRDDAMAAR